MKPIAVIAPGLETGTITAATVYDDTETTFGKDYTPKNYYTGYKGLMTIREAIEISANIPHVKALADIGLENSLNFCESVGLPRFKDEGLSLALGGLSKGVTVTEMAGAYAAIANDGNYIEPTFYKYVTDGDDNVVIEPNQTTNQVMSEANAYVEKSILTEPVVGENGTAKYCAIKEIDVAAKTGTTNDDYDRWLCGFTPYYTAVCWYGYETNATVKYNGNPAGKIWDEVMTSVHENLEAKTFTRPKEIVEVEVCKSTGLKAVSTCSKTYTEVFSEDNVPEDCGKHGGSGLVMICTQTNLLCSEGCPYGEWRSFSGAVPPHEKNAKAWKSTYGTSGLSAPTEYCPHNSGVDADWLARQKQAEAEAQALEARIRAEQAAQEAQTPAAPVETIPAETTPAPVETTPTPTETAPSTDTSGGEAASQ